MSCKNPAIPHRKCALYGAGALPHRFDLLLVALALLLWTPLLALTRGDLSGCLAD